MRVNDRRNQATNDQKQFKIGDVVELEHINTNKSMSKLLTSEPMLIALTSSCGVYTACLIQIESGVRRWKSFTIKDTSNISEEEIMKATNAIGVNLLDVILTIR